MAARHQSLVVDPCGLGENAGAGCFRIAQCLCQDEIPPDSPGWTKQDAQLAMAASRQNLRGAANRITLNQQTPTIA